MITKVLFIGGIRDGDLHIFEGDSSLLKSPLYVPKNDGLSSVETYLLEHLVSKDSEKWYPVYVENNLTSKDALERLMRYYEPPGLSIQSDQSDVMTRLKHAKYEYLEALIAYEKAFDMIVQSIDVVRADPFEGKSIIAELEHDIITHRTYARNKNFAEKYG